jgi:hypothetical protein
MTTTEAIEAMARAEGAEVVHVSSGAMSAMVRSEIECQLDAAHKYKRSIVKFLHDATTMATISQEVAESCIYSMPRGGKQITGPSVRLAEICASAYGNLQVACRVADAEEKEVIAQGAAWDMEKNLRATIEVRRRITNKNGRRYEDDMITVTGNAAASIALRNAIFRVVPRAYVDTVYERARAVAVGDAKTLGARREQLLERFQKMGVTKERVLAAVEKTGIEDIGLTELETLIGMGTAIKNGDKQIDELFPEIAPPPVKAPDGQRMSLKSQPKPEAGREPGDD